jgi:hypothetical protein
MLIARRGIDRQAAVEVVGEKVVGRRHARRNYKRTGPVLLAEIRP